MPASAQIPPLPLRRLRELDALRGLAALAVVLFHYTARFHELFPHARPVSFAFSRGDVPVLVFFAISGFAMLATLERMDTLAGFAWQRFARLFPAYWAGLVATLLVERALHAPEILRVQPWQALVNFTMLQDFLLVPPVDGASWSLAVELAFYACIALLWRAGALARIEVVTMLWLLLRLATISLLPDVPHRLNLLLVLPYLPWFVIGIATYRVWRGARRWRDQAPVLAMALINVAMTEESALLLGAVLLIALFWSVEQGYLRGLSIRPLLLLGRISYPLYLVHQHIGYSLMLRLQDRGLSPEASMALALLVALVLSALISYLVEWPAQRWLLAARQGRSARGPGPMAGTVPLSPVDSPVDSR